MLMLFALTVASIVVVGAVVYEIRSALFGLELSNGVEVLVSREMYWSIVRHYQMDDEVDHSTRWDHAVLDVIRPVRPHEWRYLVRSLGYQIASAENMGTRRHRQSQSQMVKR